MAHVSSFTRATDALKKEATLPKFNSSPLKSYRAPIGKACLPTTIFSGENSLLNFGGVLRLMSLWMTSHIFSQSHSTDIPPFPSPTHRIHVWYIHLHLVDLYGKCRYIYHTWILWARYYHILHERILPGAIAQIGRLVGCKRRKTETPTDVTNVKKSIYMGVS